MGKFGRAHTRFTHAGGGAVAIAISGEELPVPEDIAAEMAEALKSLTEDQKVVAVMAADGVESFRVVEMDVPPS